jgi:rhodanese-related sulfurtransferase
MTSTIEPKDTCSPRELADSVADCFLLDVRTAAEYRERHIDGSVLIPMTQVNPDKVKELSQGKSACVVICASGKRASMTAAKLREAGANRTQVLEGGIQAWEGAGLPVIRGKAAVSLERQVRIAAGTLVATGCLLAWLVNPAWLILPSFVGCGLVFAGITDTCGMGLLLAYMPWNK